MPTPDGAPRALSAPKQRARPAPGKRADGWMDARSHLDDGREVVELTTEWYSRVWLYRGRLPGLVLVEGSDEFVLTAGPRQQDAHLAREFAISLAANALTFADMCRQRLTAARGWPTEDPELEGEEQW